MFVLFFGSLSIARTPKDIEEFRETTNLAKDVWKVVLTRLKTEIKTKDDPITTHETIKLVEKLRSPLMIFCPLILIAGLLQ
jgi:hypothetical protein